MVIIDDDGIMTELMPQTPDEIEVECEHQHPLTLQKVFSENVVETIVDWVVHKIQETGQSDIMQPHVISKEPNISTYQSTENIQQTVNISRDVEHIAELQKFVSSPNQLKRVVGLNTEEVKMETDAEEQCSEFTKEEMKAKGKIMFHNNILALNMVLGKRCRKEKDVTTFEETLYSLDRTFSRGVCRDVESFFNCIVAMVHEHANSSQLHMDITLHIAVEARACYLVSTVDYC